MGRGIGSLLLGLMTVELIRIASSAQCGFPCRDIADIAAVPGLFITDAIYPEGVHTSAPGWVVVFLGTDVLFYGCVWFGILWLLTSCRRRRLSP